MLTTITDQSSARFCGMRLHELALQHWLYTNFLVASGVPVPVVFSAPMDAFAHFQQLWGSDHNPFSYLLQAKDEQGAPLYQPYPEPARYPLIAVSRKGWAMRATQNYAIHRYRHISWPTVSADVAREDLGLVQTARMPMAWNFKFQLDFFSLRPDTQALFLHVLMSKFWMTGGATPRCFIPINFPPYYGLQWAHMTLDGNAVENTTPESPADDAVPEYRTSCQLTVEGWVPDLEVVEYPALWALVLRAGFSATPDALYELFCDHRKADLRVGSADSKPILYTRDNVPAPSPTGPPPLPAWPN